MLCVSVIVPPCYTFLNCLPKQNIDCTLQVQILIGRDIDKQGQFIRLEAIDKGNAERTNLDSGLVLMWQSKNTLLGGKIG